MCAVIGSEPTIMLTGPTPACRKALAKAGMAASDIDLWEINEAFATVPMKTARDLGVSLDRVNVNGGAIAMGHPLGATGAIILARRWTSWSAPANPRPWPPQCVGAAWASPPSSNVFEQRRTMTQHNSVTFTVDADGIGLVTFDQPGRAMNVLTPELLGGFATLLDRLEQEDGLKGLVLTSASPASSRGRHRPAEPDHDG